MTKTLFVFLCHSLYILTIVCPLVASEIIWLNWCACRSSPKACLRHILSGPDHSTPRKTASNISAHVSARPSPSSLPLSLFVCLSTCQFIPLSVHHLFKQWMHRYHNYRLTVSTIARLIRQLSKFDEKSVHTYV